MIFPFIFGTHDSAAYYLDSTSKIYNINPIVSDVLQLFGHDHHLVYDWSKTQTHNISTQIDLGAKYIDLRAIQVGGSGEWYSCHGLVGSKLDTILQQIPNDVIIELTTYHQPDTNLCDLLQDKLVYMSRENTYCDGTLDVKIIKNTFAGTPHLEDMVNYNKRLVINHQHSHNNSQLLKMSWTLTPNVFTMIKSLYEKPKTLLDLAQEANDAWPSFVEWMTIGNYTWPNIVIFDFYEIVSQNFSLN
jgi:hypothetical protein